MTDNKSLLQDFIATYNDPSVARDFNKTMDYFPELKGKDDLLKDYIATYEDKSIGGDIDKLNSLFPEFFEESGKKQPRTTENISAKFFTPEPTKSFEASKKADVPFRAEDEKQKGYLFPMVEERQREIERKKETEPLRAGETPLTQEDIKRLSFGKNDAFEGVGKTIDKVQPGIQTKPKENLFEEKPRGIDKAILQNQIEYMQNPGNQFKAIMKGAAPERIEDREYMDALYSTLTPQEQYEAWKQDKERWDDHPATVAFKTINDEQAKWMQSGAWNAVEKVDAGVASIIGGLSNLMHRNIEKPLWGWTAKNPDSRMIWGRIADFFLNESEYQSSAGEMRDSMTFDKDGQMRRKDFVDYFKEGDYYKGFGDLALTGAESAPTSLTAVALSAVGQPVAGISLIGASVAGNKYKQLDKEHPELSELQKTLIAYGSGAIEAGSEMLGDVPIGKMLGRLYGKGGMTVFNKTLEDTAEGMIRNINKQLRSSKWIIPKMMFAEGSEEFAGAVGDHLLESAFSLRDFNLKDMMTDASKGFVYGFTSVAPQASMSIKGTIRNHKIASQLESIKNQFEKASDNMQTMGLRFPDFKFDGEAILSLPLSEQEQILASVMEAQNLNEEYKETIKNYLQTGNALNLALVNMGVEKIETLRKQAAAFKEVGEMVNKKTGTIDYIQLNGIDGELLVKEGDLQKDKEGNITSKGEIEYYTGEVNDKGEAITQKANAEDIISLKNQTADVVMEQRMLDIELEEFARSEFGQGMDVEVKDGDGNIYPSTIVAVTNTGFELETKDGQTFSIPFAKAVEAVEPTTESEQATQTEEAPISTTPEIQYAEKIRQVETENREQTLKRVNPDMSMPDTEGTIVSTTIDGKRIDINRGKLSLNEEGKIDTQNSDDTLYYTDEDGSVKPISSTDLNDVISIVDATQEIAQRNSLAMTELIKQYHAENHPYNIGDMATGNSGMSAVVHSVNEDGTYNLLVEVPDEKGKIVPVEENGVTHEEMYTSFGFEAPDFSGSDIMSMATEHETLLNNEAEQPTETGVENIEQTEETPQHTPEQIEAIELEQQQLAQEELARQEKEEFYASLPIIEKGEGMGLPDTKKMSAEQTVRYFDYEFGELETDRAIRTQIEILKKEADRLTKASNNDPFNVLKKQKAKEANENLKEFQKISRDRNVARFEESNRREAESGIDTFKDMQDERRRKNKQETATNLEDVENNWNNSKKVIGWEDTFTKPNGETIQGRWVLTEATSATPSHDPNTLQSNQAFEINGKNINDNDYTTKRHEVESKAQSFDTRAIDSPIVVHRGAVVSGNNRTMSRQLAAQKGTDKAYLDGLKEKLKKYGIEASELDNFDHPTLYFESTTPVEFSTKSYGEFNQRETKSKSATEKAIIASKRNDTALIGQITDAMNNFETLQSFYASENAQTEVLKMLVESGTVHQNDVAEIFDENRFTPAGKDFLESTILGNIVKEDQIKMLNSNKAIRAKIVGSFIPLLENKGKGTESIISELNDAIKYIYEADNSGMTMFEYFSKQDMFEQQDIDLNAVSLAVALQRDGFRKFVADVNSKLNGVVDVFTGRPTNKQDVIDNLINTFNQEERAIYETARRKHEGQGRGGLDTSTARNSDGAVQRGRDGDIKTGSQNQAKPEQASTQRGIESQTIETPRGSEATLRELFDSATDIAERKAIATQILEEVQAKLPNAAQHRIGNTAEFLESLSSHPESLQDAKDILASSKHIPGVFLGNKIGVFINIEHVNSYDELIETYLHEQTHSVNTKKYTREEIANLLDNPEQYIPKDYHKTPNYVKADEAIAHETGRLLKDNSIEDILDGNINYENISEETKPIVEQIINFLRNNENNQNQQQAGLRESERTNETNTEIHPELRERSKNARDVSGTGIGRVHSEVVGRNNGEGTRTTTESDKRRDQSPDSGSRTEPVNLSELAQKKVAEDSDDIKTARETKPIDKAREISHQSVGGIDATVETLSNGDISVTTKDAVYLFPKGEFDNMIINGKKASPSQKNGHIGAFSKRYIFNHIMEEHLDEFDEDLQRELDEKELAHFNMIVKKATIEPTVMFQVAGRDGNVWIESKVTVDREKRIITLTPLVKNVVEEESYQYYSSSLDLDRLRNPSTFKEYYEEEAYFKSDDNLNKSTTETTPTNLAELAKQKHESNKIDKAVAQADTNPTEAQKEAGNYQKGHINVQGFDITIENPAGSERSGIDGDGKSWSITMQNHYGYFKRTKGKDGDQIDVFVGTNPGSGKVFVIDQIKAANSNPIQLFRERFDKFLNDHEFYPSDEQIEQLLRSVVIVNTDDAVIKLFEDAFPTLSIGSKSASALLDIADAYRFDESKVMLGFNSKEEAEKAYLSNYEAGWQGLGAITETNVEDFKKWLYDGKKQSKAFSEYKASTSPSERGNVKTVSAKDFGITTEKYAKNADKAEQERVNQLKPDENGDLKENGDYVFQHTNVYPQYGSTIKVSNTIVKGVNVIERETYPFSIFQKIRTIYMVDLILPDNTVVENGEMVNWYEADGYAHPQFENFEDAVRFIEKWRNDNPKTETNNNIRFRIEDWRDGHSAPGMMYNTLEESLEDGGDFNLSEVARGYHNQPNDYFDTRVGARYYMYDTPAGHESLSAINNVVRAIKAGKDRKKITVTAYRAVPNSVKEEKLINNDWITFSETYAKNHGKHRFGEGEYKIIEQEVPIHHVWWDGNDINEWGYDNTNNIRFRIIDELSADTELQSIKEKAIADGTFMKAPNGKPTNLNERQWIDVRTKAFKEWFGDWINDPKNASKVVDENGEPMVVYHGVPPRYYNFNIFELYNEGIFFSEDKYVAKRYATDYSGEFGHIKECYLKIDKPELVKNVKYKFNGFSGSDANLKKRSEKFKQERPELSNTPYKYKELVRKTSEKKGHDGFILENHSWGENIDYSRQFTVFSPNQIKSATGNVGTFSNESNDIRFSIITPSELFEQVEREGMESLSEDWDGAIKDIWSNAPSEVKKELVETMKKKGVSSERAVENYLSSIATDGAMPVEFDRIRKALKLNKDISDQDLKMALWVNNNPNDQSIAWKAKFENLQKLNDPNNLIQAGKQQIKGAIEEYERRVHSLSNKNLTTKLIESHMDNMVSLKILQEAISGGINKVPMMLDAYRMNDIRGGKVQKAVEGFSEGQFTETYTIFIELNKKLENAIQNSVLKNTIEIMNREVEGMKKTNTNPLMLYMLAKTGLERNEVQRTKEANEFYKKEKAQVAEAREKIKSDLENGIITEVAYKNAEKKIDNFAKKLDDNIAKRIEKNTRDYSGLTELANLMEGKETADFEAIAKKMVQETEMLVNTQDLWESVQKTTRWGLDYMLDKGSINKKEYEAITGTYKYYMPLRGWDETTADDVYDYLKDGKVQLGSVIKKVNGRTSLSENPFGHILAMTTRAVMDAENNHVKATFINFVKENPNDAVSLHKLWIQNIGTEEMPEWVEVYPNIPEGASVAQTREAIDEFEKKMELLREQGQAMSKNNGLNLNYKIGRGTPSDHVVKAMVNGEELTAYIHGNPRAAQALNGKLGFDNQVEGILNITKGLNRYLSGIYTSWNIEFAATNFLRDVMQAATYAVIDKGAVYTAKFLGNLRTIKTVGMDYIFDKEGKHSDMLKEFQNYGGETGYTFVDSIKSYKKQIDQMQRQMDGSNANPIDIARGFFGIINNMNNTMEALTRFAIYKTSREMGKSADEAANDAKNATLNFNRHGSGEWGNRWIRDNIIFYNAGMQGLYKMYNVGRENPKRIPALIAGWFTLGFLNYILTTTMMSLFGSDDPDKEYMSVSNYKRRTNLILHTPKGMFTYPISHEFRWAFGVGELMSTAARGEIKLSNLPKEMLKQMGGILPLDVAGGARAFIPSYLSPILEAYWLNENFMGLPISKEREGFGSNKHMPGHTKATNYTWKSMVDASRYINKATGGTEQEKGLISIDPAKLQHVIQNATGGYGTVFLEPLMLGLGGKEDTRQWQNKTPILRRLYNAKEPDRFEKLANREFYQMKDDYIDEAEQNAGGYKKEAKEALSEVALKMGLQFEQDKMRNKTIHKDLFTKENKLRIKPADNKKDVVVDEIADYLELIEKLNELYPETAEMTKETRKNLSKFVNSKKNNRLVIFKSYEKLMNQSDEETGILLKMTLNEHMKAYNKGKDITEILEEISELGTEP